MIRHLLISSNEKKERCAETVAQNFENALGDCAEVDGASVAAMKPPEGRFEPF